MRSHGRVTGWGGRCIEGDSPAGDTPLALERRAESEQVLPGIRLVVGWGWTASIPGLRAKSE